MAQEYRIYKKCPVCDGDGVVTATSPLPPHDLEGNQCLECLGPNAEYPKSGGIYIGWLEKVDV